MQATDVSSLNKSAQITSVAMRSGRAWRLLLTVWLVYVVHFGTNVVRETYLAVAIGDSFSLRVDEYVGLHPDLFEMSGRGAYINNNPGASMLAAFPYTVARPVIGAILRARPELARPKPPAQYNDPRPNRTRYMNEARARGVDIKLALAAAAMQAGLMAPLGALAALGVFFYLRARYRDERLALWMALLYAFATPLFFRSAFLNQNAIVAHAVLFAYMAATGTRVRAEDEPISHRQGAVAGSLLGIAVLTDYSAVPLFLVFGAWIVWEGARGPNRAQNALRSGAAYVAGAMPAIALLMLYQWLAFGNPFLPAQAYMPATEYSTQGWNGIFWPDPTLLFGNLFDPQYGLLVFCPMLAAALFAGMLRKRPAGPSRRELTLIFGASFALYLFISSVQFAYLQFNTGVRYLVPAVPLLFFALVPVLLRLPRLVLYSLLLPTVVISWSVAMARESVTESLTRVLLRGFELPWLTVMEKTASGYAPWLADGVSALPVLLLTAAIVYLIWRQPSIPRAGS